MPDPRAVPEAEVRERLARSNLAWAWDRSPDEVMKRPAMYPNVLSNVGLRWDGTAYLDTEGSQE